LGWITFLERKLMTTSTAQANPNIAFIKYSGEKLRRTNGAAGLGAGNITSGSTFYREIKTKQIA